MAAAEHPALHQAELLSSGQLPLAGETGKTGQVVDAAPSPAHPVAGVHLPATLGTLSAKPTVRKKNKGEGYTDVNCIFISDPAPYMIFMQSSITTGGDLFPCLLILWIIILFLRFTSKMRTPAEMHEDLIIDGNTDVLSIFLILI